MLVMFYRILGKHYNVKILFNLLISPSQKQTKGTGGTSSMRYLVSDDQNTNNSR